MLRTMGSSLMAKASPGGAFRKTEEARIENPALPGKGEIGTISRGMMEEPIERQVPPGSTKVVSSSPAVEPTAATAPIGMLPTQPLAPTQPSTPGITPTRGAASTPDTGMIQPALRSQSTGVAGKTVSGGALPGAQAATLYQPPQGSQTDVLGASSDMANENVKPFIGSAIGGKVIAGEGNDPTKTYRPTTLQQVVGSAGSAINKIGSALGAGQVVPGGIGAKMQTWGGAPTIAAQGIGSAGNALRSVAQAATTKSAVGQAAQKVSGWLRSLFGR